VSQENSLKAAADTIANALSAQPTRVFGALDDGRFDPAQGDLYVHALHHEPLLDGYPDDWSVPPDLQVLPSHGVLARLAAGSTERWLFLYLEVDQSRFTPEPGDAQPARDRYDRVEITLERPDESPETVLLATSAPGLIEARSMVPGDDGTGRIVPEPRIEAFWLQTSRGYHLEARIPRSFAGGSAAGARMWLEVVNGADGGRAGTRSENTPDGGRLFMVTPHLDELLSTFMGAGTRATVVDLNALKLGTSGSLLLNKDEDVRAAGGTWYRRFIAGDTAGWPVQRVSPGRLEGRSVTEALAGHPAAGWLRAGQGQSAVLSAAAPIVVDGRLRGAIVLEQAGDQLLELRDRALDHLFNLTLLASALAAAVAFGVASWISLRIARLRLAADTAVGNDGRIRLGMPESGKADEIGALSRGFQRLLIRLDEHTQYLRTLGGKLSHELRTPLSIVRSSLDNLESEGVREDQRKYLTRAREGTLRLQSILSALGAASRVEASIQQAERARFDLAALLQSAVAGYRDAFPQSRIELDLPDGECTLHGAPDLLVQMLDKLVDNAVDFCAPSGCIRVGLERAGDHVDLRVGNDGPPISEAVLGNLFESLFEHRDGRDEAPHFGLGLYIVRLIAEFHGGQANAANRTDGSGPVFTVSLPLL
jgi:dedicated sortase system histidine kinase